MRSLLETYGIPSTLSYDVPNLVYPNNVGEIRVSVPEGLGDEALRILAAHRTRAASPLDASSAEPPKSFPASAPLSARTNGEQEEEEEDDEDEEDDWDDDDEDGGEEDLSDDDEDEDELDDDDDLDDEE